MVTGAKTSRAFKSPHHSALPTRKSPTQTHPDRKNSAAHWNWARYYHAELGRFISRDPIGYVDGMNFYRAYFVAGDVDPDGTNLHESVCLPLCGIGGLLGGQKAQTQAEDLTWKHFHQSGNGGPSDAFRHCIWSCLMVKSFFVNRLCAECIGNAHEAGNLQKDSSPLSLQLIEMDLRNNTIGRCIGADCWTVDCCVYGCWDAMYGCSRCGELTVVEGTKPDIPGPVR